MVMASCGSLDPEGGGINGDRSFLSEQVKIAQYCPTNYLIEKKAKPKTESSSPVSLGRGVVDCYRLLMGPEVLRKNK